MSSLLGWPLCQSQRRWTSVPAYLGAFALCLSLMEANDLLWLKPLAWEMPWRFAWEKDNLQLFGSVRWCFVLSINWRDPSTQSESDQCCKSHVDFMSSLNSSRQTILFLHFCTGLGTVCSIDSIHLLAAVCLAALAGGFARLPAWSRCFNPGFNPRVYGRLQTSDSWSVTGRSLILTSLEPLRIPLSPASPDT